MNFDKRWQVSLRDSNDIHYDHYFVTKPTRKQIRKLHRNITIKYGICSDPAINAVLRYPNEK